MKRAAHDSVETFLQDGKVIKPEVERLRREHRELKARLSELNSRLYLSSDEEVERKKIQKLKLATKDRLAMLDALQRRR